MAEISSLCPARRSGSFTFPIGSISAVSQFNPNEHSEETEIPGRVQASIPHFSLLGPVYLFGDATIDAAQRDDPSSLIAEGTRSDATRHHRRWRYLAGCHLALASIGVPASAIAPTMTALDGVEQEDQSQSVPFSLFKVACAWSGEAITSRLLPQIGYTWLGGDRTPEQRYDFEDEHDDLASDRQFISTNLSGSSTGWVSRNSLLAASMLVGASAIKTGFIDADDTEQISDSPLINLRLEAAGR